MPDGKWSDERLDELVRRFDGRMGDLARRQDTLEQRINGMPAKVDNLGRELRDVKREITAPDGAVGRLAKKLDEIIGNPIAERRKRMEALVTTAALVVGTGLVTFVVYAILGAK